MFFSHYSFVFPVHNEQRFLSSQVIGLVSFLKKNKISSYEILLVENGSQDGSWKEISRLVKKNPQIKGLRIQKASYGRAVKHGLLAAQGHFIYLVNVDFIDEIFILQSEKMMLTKKCGLVVGSKIHPLSQDNRSHFRKATTIFFNWVISLLVNYQLGDTHGIKVFKNNEFFKKTIYLCNSKNELFDTELILKLARAGVRKNEIPVIVNEIRVTRYKCLSRFINTLVDLKRLLLAKVLNINSISNVGADDFGISKVVNQAILDLAAAGSIQAVSVLSNLVSRSELKKLLKLQESKQFLIGAHLNLVRGKPVTNPNQIKSLVNEAGFFYPLPVLIWKLAWNRINNSELTVELTNQIKKLQNQGLKIDYLDSEQHVHTLGLVSKIVNQIAQKQKISIRSQYSSSNYLKIHLIRYLVYSLIQKFLPSSLGNGWQRGSNIDLAITHPGADYD